MPRKGVRPDRILVPSLSPRSKLKQAVRTIESDSEFSATREEFDLDELPSSPEMTGYSPRSPKRQPLDFSAMDRDFHPNTTQSAFDRIMERDYVSDEAVLIDESEDGYTDHHPLSRRHPSATPPFSPVPSLLDVYRPDGLSWGRILTIIILFVWMSYLQSQDDDYYERIPLFGQLYAIVAASFLAELVMDMPGFAYRRPSQAGWNPDIWGFLFKVIIGICYFLVSWMVLIRVVKRKLDAFEMEGM